MAGETVTSLEVLFTANTSAVDAAAKQVQGKAEQIEKKPVKATVDADVKGALASMDRVEDAARKIVTAKTMATVDANIERAEKNLAKTKERLDYLRSVDTDLEVTADIKRAESALQRMERQRDALLNARSKLEVEADVAKAEDNLKELGDTAEQVGKSGGARAGSGLVSSLDGATRGAGQAVGDAIGGDLGSSLESALQAIPIAGGIILAATAIGKAVVGAVQDGMGVEVGRDRLQALTGLDEAQAAKLANAAAEAYANNFGESVEANMDAARLGSQFQLIDPAASVRDAQTTISSLSGIADVLEEDVRPTAQAVSVMLSSGIASSAEEAFDVLAAGAREGVNRSEDLLDTFTEYPALFARLGLDGPEALGLINQAMQAGARNSDVAADALKEFQIRATDGSKSSAAGFEALGMNAEKMTAKIAKGGKGAHEGLEEVLDGLRKMKDPVEQNAAAVALFGTKAEDLGDALFAMDLSGAVDSLDGVTGAAQAMFDTLSDNDASKIESAQRNIEVAMDGVKGALAGAFADPLGDLADWVSANRGPLLQFFADLVNGAIDFAQAANTGIGDFVSGPLASAIEGLASLIDWLPGDQDTSELTGLADSMRGFSGTTEAANAELEGMRGKFNSFADAQIQLGYLNDAARETAEAVGKVGTDADGSAAKLGKLDTAHLNSTKSGRDLASQLVKASDALDDELSKAQEAGEGQKELKDRYYTTTGALKDQLRQAGLTDKQIDSLIKTYLKTPKKRVTEVEADGAGKAERDVDSMRKAVEKLPKKKRSELEAALDRGKVDYVRSELDRLSKTRTAWISVERRVVGSGGKETATALAHGGIVEFFARGGLRRENHVAQIARAGDYRVWAEDETGGESYIPLHPSKRARSMDIWMETGRRLGAIGFAGGGVSVDSGTAKTVATLNRGTLPLAELAALAAALKRATGPLAGLEKASKDARTALSDARSEANTLQAASNRANRELAAAEKIDPNSRLGKANADLARAQKAVDPDSKLGRSRQAVRDAEEKLASAKGKKAREKAEKELDKAQARNQKREDARQRRIDEAQEKADYYREAHDKKVAEKQAKAEKAEAAVNKAIEKRTKAEEAAEKASAKLTERQQKAEQAAADLASAQQALADAARSASESLQDQYMQGGDAADLAENMGEGAAAMAEFAALIEQLRKLGLDESVIQQIIDQGVEAGSETAADILAGGASQVDALNKSAKALRDIADKLGLLTAAGQRNYANGGFFEPMAPAAQMVPPSTWRVVGDRTDVPELYAPLDGSARSWALLMEGLRRMPGAPPFELMAAGAVTGAGGAAVRGGTTVVNQSVTMPVPAEAFRDVVSLLQFAYDFALHSANA